LCGGVRSDAGLVERLRCESAGERFDLACELALLEGQLQHPSGERAQCEQAAAKLGVASSLGSRRGKALHQACSCQRPQLSAQRLRGCDQEVTQLAERRTLRVDRTLACSHQRLQRLAFAAGTWRRRPPLAEHASGSTDRVERVGLATRAPL
jgi:hypothetical protein